LLINSAVYKIFPVWGAGRCPLVEFGVKKLAVKPMHNSNILLFFDVSKGKTDEGDWGI
jgi:hypothetical protein